MSAEHEQQHPYHLVDPSPWPVLGAFSAGITAVGLVLFMHDVTALLLPVGVIMLLATVAIWWRDVVREAHGGHHTKIVQLGLRYGMALFIASEVMFFAAFFWAFFDASLYFDQAQMWMRVLYTGGEWPPAGVEAIEALDLPLLNTMILLLSGCTVTWAHHGMVNGDRTTLINALIITVLLGLFFTSVQIYEYGHATFAFAFQDGVAGAGGIYPSVFYMATGFHGFHVVVGTIFLMVCLVRAMKGHFNPDQHFGFEAAAWYWHFVDVVWIFLFSFVYFFFGVP
jgi:cytochrome c oxidase subunit 3